MLNHICLKHKEEFLQKFLQLSMYLFIFIYTLTEYPGTRSEKRPSNRVIKIDQFDIPSYKYMESLTEKRFSDLHMYVSTVTKSR